jgi:hypothetical protein
MMMWTKNAVSPSRPDGDGGNVHQIRGSSFRTLEGGLAPAASVDGPARASTQVVHVQEGTPEQIAYKLFLHILELEAEYVTRPPAHHLERREYILNTYAQCIRAVRDGTVG